MTRVHGLFVGIDQYLDPGFNGLQHAEQDARVLHALFLDTFGEGGTLLVGEDATTRRIERELARLGAEETEADVVFIAFSGHGTQSRELIAYDTDRDRLDETALPLGGFVRLVERIKAKLVVVVLDCCYSGQAWSEHLNQAVVTHPAKSSARDDDYLSRSAEVHEILDRLDGENRFVIAAARPTERAYEIPEFGHGQLTYHVITGLIRDAVVDGRVAMARLMTHVLENVGWTRGGIGDRQQNPVVEGSFGNASMPAWRPGERYAEVGGNIPSAVNWGLSSMHGHGVPKPFTERLADFIPRLNDLQMMAINQGGLLRGKSVLVNAPTAAGKTLIAVLPVIRAWGQGKRSIILLPSRALVREQYTRLRQYASIGLRAIRVTGDLRDQLGELYRGEYDVAVLTYEKYIGLLARHPRLLTGTAVLVIDEIHHLFDKHRGPALEYLLTRVRRQALVGPVPQLVGLSSVLGDPDGLAEWLSAQLITSSARAVPLVEGVIRPDGRFIGANELELMPPAETASPDDVITAIVRAEVERGHRVIVFRSTRQAAQETALRLSKELGLPTAGVKLRGRDVGLTYHRLRDCLGGGVAFHIADLTDAQRAVVEDNFRAPDSTIRVVVATMTLAHGVNLPADTVVIGELKHPGDVEYSVAEYRNMAGRAGRPGSGVAEGRSMIVAADEADARVKLRRYVQAEPEAERSALRSESVDLSTLVLTALAAGRSDRGHEDDVFDFLDRTFAARQARREGAPPPFSREQVRAEIVDLKSRGFLEHREARLVPTALAGIVVGSGLDVPSVAAIDDAVGNMEEPTVNRSTLVCLAHLAREVWDHRFARKTKNRNALKEALREKLTLLGADEHVVIQLLAVSGDHGFAAARQALACLYWIGGSELSWIEQALVRGDERTRMNPPVAQAMRRTADVVEAVVRVVDGRLPMVNLGDIAGVLPVQLELGIISGHVPVARYVDRDLDRQVYLRLAGAGLTGAAALADAGDAELLDCCGDVELVSAVRQAARAAVVEEARLEWPDVRPPFAEQG
ncbi:DEAD/DEAH box helicase [Actinokineospora enzanensis]|uniref:DEAD/DEAH box helicase n=1 Tax=Actinokineospora enzanensis TaxID=155975 RepID=UPI00037C967F|nr:DEAD/DEAH box helicase [Actinokineospora enzanensis]